MWELEKVHQIGELCAAVAVVVSLIFVGYEVRQNSVRQMQATTQTVVSSYSAQLNMISTDPELACFYSKATWDLSDLDGVRGFRFSAWMLATNRIIEDVYFQQLQGSVEPEIWAAIERSLRFIVAPFPGFREWYERFGVTLSDEFRAYMEELFAQTELAERSNSLSSSC